MENKIITTVIVMGAIVILTVGVIAFSGDSKKPSTQQQPLLQNTSDHHRQAPPDQSVFNSLLGKSAPDFKLESYDGKTFELNKLRGKKVLLFFTEGLMCYPACWNQMAAFGDDPSFNNSDVVTLNIGVDTKNDWAQAIQKMPQLSKAIVLFDTNRGVSQKYGVLTLPSSMHKGQYPGHAYVILDREGVVKFTLDDPLMGVRNEELKKELLKIK